MARGLRPDNFQESESGEEEEDSAEDASSESDSEPEQKPIARNPSPLPPPLKKSQSQLPSKTQKDKMKGRSDSDSATETESEPGSETESDGPSPETSKKSNDISGKPTPKPVTTPVRSSAVKRPAEDKETGNDSKRPKAKTSPETELENSAKKSNDDSKKQLFQRLWSEDDEIAILRGMIDYVDKKKSDPIADLNAFHSFIKNNLHVDVSRNQLQDKIRRLKKKYENNKNKVKEGKERTFTKPHEQKAYELSKHIWGNENVKESPSKATGSTVKRNHKNTSVVENVEFEHVKNVEAINTGRLDRIWSTKAMRSNDVSMDERVHSIGSELFNGSNGVEENSAKEWRELRVQEIELHLKMLEVMHAQTKLVVDFLKSTNQ